MITAAAQLKLRMDYDQTTDIGPMPNSRNLFNTYIGSQLLKSNPDFITRIQTTRSFFNPYIYAPYNTLDALLLDTGPLTEEELSNGRCGYRNSFLGSQWTWLTELDLLKSLQRMQSPHVTLNADSTQTSIFSPICPRLVPMLYQLLIIPKLFADSNIHGIYSELQLGSYSVSILDMEKMELTVKVLL